MKKSTVLVLEKDSPSNQKKKSRSRGSDQNISTFGSAQAGFNPFSWMVLYQQWMSLIVHKPGELVIDWEGVGVAPHQPIEGPRHVRVSWHSFRGKVSVHPPRSLNEAVLASDHLLKHMSGFNWFDCIKNRSETMFFEVPFDYLSEVKKIGVWLKYDGCEQKFSMIARLIQPNKSIA